MKIHLELFELDSLLSLDRRLMVLIHQRLQVASQLVADTTNTNNVQKHWHNKLYNGKYTRTHNHLTLVTFIHYRGR